MNFCMSAIFISIFCVFQRISDRILFTINNLDRPSFWHINCDRLLSSASRTGLNFRELRLTYEYLAWVSFNSTYLGMSQRVLRRILWGALQVSYNPPFRSGMLRHSGIPKNKTVGSSAV